MIVYCSMKLNEPLKKQNCWHLKTEITIVQQNKCDPLSFKRLEFPTQLRTVCSSRRDGVNQLVGGRQTRRRLLSALTLVDCLYVVGIRFSLFSRAKCSIGKCPSDSRQKFTTSTVHHFQVGSTLLRPCRDVSSS